MGKIRHWDDIKFFSSLVAQLVVIDLNMVAGDLRKSGLGCCRLTDLVQIELQLSAAAERSGCKWANGLGAGRALAAAVLSRRMALASVLLAR
jgi:hypothetical protein